MSRQDLKSTMAEDGLLTNMRISGDIQGVSQLIMSLSLVLDTQAAEEKGNKSSNTGGGGKLSEAKKERMEVRPN